jgi:hypothetical protein
MVDDPVPFGIRPRACSPMHEAFVLREFIHLITLADLPLNVFYFHNVFTILSVFLPPA